MPKIDPDHWRALSPHLDHALDLPEEERACWLAGLRAGQPQLAAELEILLRDYRALDREGFLAGDAGSTAWSEAARRR